LSANAVQIKFPFTIDDFGRVARTDYSSHVRQMIEQVLFTMPGERVNRPDFGCGLSRWVFDAASTEMQSASHALVQGSLQHWMGDIIRVLGVDITLADSELIVTVRYSMLATGEKLTARFQR
jgi:phage baseplate assembly protein W